MSLAASSRQRWRWYVPTYRQIAPQGWKPDISCQHEEQACKCPALCMRYPSMLLPALLCPRGFRSQLHAVPSRHAQLVVKVSTTRLQAQSTLEQRRRKVRQTLLPMITTTYMEVHDRHEVARQKLTRLQALMAATEAEMAQGAGERASTARWMLQCMGPAVGGQHPAHDIADALRACQPAAAASFLEAIYE